jgi:hypothetical protein
MRQSDQSAVDFGSAHQLFLFAGDWHAGKRFSVTQRLSVALFFQ